MQPEDRLVTSNDLRILVQKLTDAYCGDIVVDALQRNNFTPAHNAGLLVQVNHSYSLPKPHKASAVEPSDTHLLPRVNLPSTCLSPEVNLGLILQARYKMVTSMAL